jgi:hypothetical protein
MYSLYGLFSVFSIFYALVLIVLFLGKGFGQVIWPIIVFVCFYNEFDVNESTGMYVINETVPMWLFHPMNLFGGLLLAVIIYVALKMSLD